MKNKIAIRVNNKREFDYLMRHFESKLWVIHSEIDVEYPLIGYCKYEKIYNEEYCDKANIKVLDFPTFAQIAGIEVVNEIKISLNKGLAIVKQNAVYFEGNPCDFNLSGRQLEEINAAYKSLQ